MKQIKKLLIIIFLILFFPFYSQDLNSKAEIENKKKIDKIEVEFQSIKDRTDNHISLITIFLAISGIFITLGFGASLIGYAKNENRAKEVFELYKKDKINQDVRDNELYNIFLTDKNNNENRSDEIYKMFLLDKNNNEKKSEEMYKMFLSDKNNNEKRTDEMYKMFLTDKANEQNTLVTTSQTITLVKETLELAKQASERSSQSLFLRLENIRDNIEKESKKIIKDSEAFDDGKNLILRKFIQTEIHRVANKIEGLENNLVILEAEGQKKLIITPHATFIKGTEQYLKDQYEEALTTWESIINSDIVVVDDNLRALTFYWIGYLNNNLYKFKDGIFNFKEAEKISKKHELKRLQIETKFFNNEKIESIILELDKLLTTIKNDKILEPEDKKSISSKVLNTFGNVYYASYRETKDKQYLIKSKKCFLTILNLNENDDIEKSIKSFDKSDKNTLKWVIFGLAESMYHIENDNKTAINLFKNEVINLVELEYENREEKRTKVLAKTCLLFCHYRIDPNDSVQMDKDKMMIDIQLQDLDKNLTIYSQLVRKNVKYNTFKEHIKLIVDKKA